MIIGGDTRVWFSNLGMYSRHQNIASLPQEVQSHFTVTKIIGKGLRKTIWFPVEGSTCGLRDLHRHKSRNEYVPSARTEEILCYSI